MAHAFSYTTFFARISKECIYRVKKDLSVYLYIYIYFSGTRNGIRKKLDIYVYIRSMYMIMMCIYTHNQYQILNRSKHLQIYNCMDSKVFLKLLSGYCKPYPSMTVVEITCLIMAIGISNKLQVN